MNASAKQNQSRWQCPSCDSEDQHVFFEIKDVPVFCNVLWHSKKEALECTKGEIRLAFCERCQLVHNLSYDPELLKYSQAYENSLHHSKRFQDYATKLAKHLVDKYNLHKKVIVEIGCGKGEFLSMLCEFGNNKGLGFDPSYEGDGIDGITIIKDYFPQSNFQIKSDLICCRHTLEHIDNPKGFLSAVRQSMANNDTTVVFFEVPNLLFTLRDLAIWDIIYEHCVYFFSHSAKALFEECGFEVLETRDVYNGQFLCIEAVPAYERLPGASPSLGWGPESIPLNRKERASRIEIVECSAVSLLVSQFARNHESKSEKWRQKLGQIAEQGQRIVIWGSGSKGVTFLNNLNIDGPIEYAIDINPTKQGKYIAGTGQRVMPPYFLLEYRPDVIIVMNPIYVDEIRSAINEMGLSTQLIIDDSNMSSVYIRSTENL